jgi:L-lactate dehydrogenase complex protein LldG
VVEGARVSAGAREAILGRIRTALSDVPEEERDAVTAGAPAAAREPAARAPAAPPAPPDLAALFTERVEDYRATVTRCAPADVSGTIAAICQRHQAQRLAAAPGVDEAWLPPGLDIAGDDPPLDVATLDAVDGVITGSALGIAETGTIALDGDAKSGRRLLSLVPDLHICVVREADLVAGVAESIDQLHEAACEGRPITLISGPSATSDIELDRVEGVHGPRRLEVVLVGAAST